MKCIRCGKDSNYRARKEGGRCAYCSERFALEPKEGDPFTDAGFKAAIDKVSSQGNVRWTPAHLRYELGRRIALRANRLSGCTLAFLSVVCVPVGAALLASADSWLALVLVAVVALGIWWLMKGRPRENAAYIPLDRARFDSMWTRWRRVHGEPRGLIVRRARPEAQRELPSDIEEYSFDRAVVCDRSETVDLLLANNFHFENNCAVLSADGYPKHAFQTVRKMLRNNPKLVVYVLHDATGSGCELADEVARQPTWFPHATVIDVGLRPAHARDFYGELELASAGNIPGPALSPEEATWLNEYSLELACLLPEQVIKRLFKALARPVDLTAAGMLAMGAFYVDAETMRRHTVAADGGGDSFG